MTKETHFWLIAIPAIAASCGYGTPYKTSGPSLSQDGVRVEMVGQSCVANSGADVMVPSNDDLLDLGVQLQITNGSSRTITILPDGFHLVAFENGQRAEVRPRHRAPSTLPPGQTEQVRLAYEHYGNLACSDRLELDATGAIARGSSPVSIAPIEFRASAWPVQSVYTSP